MNNKIEKTNNLYPLDSELCLNDLHLFRANLYELEVGPSHQLYRQHQEHAFFYRMTFFSFGILFTVLMLTIFSNQANWIYHLFMGSFLLNKTSLCLITGSLAIASFIIGVSIRPEKEAIESIYQIAKEKIMLEYAKKRASYGLSPYYLFSLNDCSEQQTKLNKWKYEQFLALKEIKQETLCLMFQISRSKELSAEKKTKLHNQSLIELKRKYSQLQKEN